MFKYENATLIKCSAEKLYNFHLDINNLTKITPSDVKVDIIVTPFSIKEGAITNIRVTKFLIPQTWFVEYSLLEPSHMIVDTAIHSPFKFWRHSHIFTQKGDWCELKDVIEYELPFGILGKIFHGLINSDINKMFQYRHKRTKAILER